MKIPQNCLARKIKEQLFFWIGENIETIVRQIETLEGSLAANGGLDLPELSYSLYSENREHKSNSCKLAIVAESVDELKAMITSAKDLLKDSPNSLRDIKGIYFSSRGLTENGKIAFLFSGQGSQRPNMFKDLTGLFPQVQESISKADDVLKNRLPKLLSKYIFPPPASTPEEEKSHLPAKDWQAGMEALTQTNIAQPALGVVEVGLLKIMKLFGINADMLAGHSLGEYVALYAGGVFEEEMLYELLEYRGSAIVNSSKGCNLGGMLAVGAGVEDIKVLIKDIPEIFIANLNSPTQTILSGSDESLDLTSVNLRKKGIRSKKINVSCAFHSPYMAPAKDLLFKKLSTLDYKSPIVPVYSNLTAVLYPQDKESPLAPDAPLRRNVGEGWRARLARLSAKPRAAKRAGILSILSQHLVNPVRFSEEIENMFKDGARIFIEIGPGNVLTNLIKRILGERDYVAIASNVKTATDISQILNVFAQLMAEGFKVDLSALFECRNNST